jgi:hypothetical protein
MFFAPTLHQLFAFFSLHPVPMMLSQIVLQVLIA